MLKTFTRASVLCAMGAIALATSVGGQVPIAVGGGPYKLTEVDGDHTVTISVTNATEGTVDVAMIPDDANDTGCTIVADPDEVVAHRSEAVKFRLPSACDLGDKSTDLTLTVSPRDDGDDLTVAVAAETPEDTRTELDALAFFVLAAILAAFGLWRLFRAWQKRKVAKDPDPLPKKPTDSTAPNPPVRNLGARLPGLDADWSFKDSWSSNVGLAGAIFTGVLGASDVLEAILGEGHEDEVAIALLSAALSVGLIGAATLLLAIFRDTGAEKAVDRSHNTVLGVLAATGMVLTATAGQILVMAWVLTDADLVASWLVYGLAAFAMIVLAAYTYQTVPLTLTDGLFDQPSDPSAEAKALDRISAAIIKVGGPQGMTVTADSYPWMEAALETSSGDDEPRPRRRSAMP